MKKMIFASFLFALAAGFTACSSDDNGADVEPIGTQSSNIKLSADSLFLSPAGGQDSVTFTTDQEWAVISSAAWAKVSPNNGTTRKGTLIVTVDSNSTEKARIATLTLLSGTGRGYFFVKQAAGAKPDSLKCPLGNDYKLVFHDEFDKDGELSAASWTHEVKDAYWVNNELQAYVNGQIDGHRVTEVRNGKMLIHCFKLDNKVYSGRVYANVKTGYRYGYIEARLKLPKGKGTWPAFWMMPVNFSTWPGDGEIDIMEHVGFNQDVIYSTIHCNKYNNTGTATESANRKVSGATDGFHVYAMEWTADYMTFYIDGEKLFTYQNDGTGKDAWPFDSAFYPIFNLAWGGAWGGQQGVDESVLPATMEVDYLRVYQK